MAAIAEPLRPARILPKPKKFVPLRSFSCGRQGRSWEKMVNNGARRLSLGTETCPQTVVVLEGANGKLIGFCSFLPHPLPSSAGVFDDNAQRIHILGTDKQYHGKRLRDGSRPGDALLRGALEQIELACGGSMPYVSALVSPENDRSRALFDRHGFRELPYSGDGEIIYVRSPKKRLPASALWPPTRWIAQRVRKDSSVRGRAPFRRGVGVRA